MLGDRHEAEDITQETFVRAIKSLDRWDNTRRFEPWLLAIAANRCRTMLAKRRLPIIDCPDAAADMAVAPDRRVEDCHLIEEVELALDNIRPDYANAFRLFHEAHLAYGDIATTLGVPLGTVKTWVHRARREIAEQLQSRGMHNLDSPNSNSPCTTSPLTRNRDALRSNRNTPERVAG
jgi:RNA polymerase sigma-70 factor (ECF subfamily)